MVKSTLKRTKVHQNVFFLAEAHTFCAWRRASGEESTLEGGGEKGEGVFST